MTLPPRTRAGIDEDIRLGWPIQNGHDTTDIRGGAGFRGAANALAATAQREARPCMSTLPACSIQLGLFVTGH
jgi:hypothetical protein